MNPEVVLVLACFGIGFTVAYLIWAEIRPHVLRIGLASLRGRVNARMRAKGKAEDPDLAVLNLVLNLMIECAPYANAAIMFFRPPLPERSDSGARTRQMLINVLRGDDRTMQVALMELVVRLGVHILLGSVSGWCVIAYFAFMAMTGQLKKAADRAAGVLLPVAHGPMSHKPA